MQRFFFILILVSYLVTNNERDGGNGMSWGYGPDNGPACWKSLGVLDENIGSEQSPVNVPAEAPTLLSEPLEFCYGRPPWILRSLGSNVQVDLPGAFHDQNFIVFRGERYNLLQFHFHNPSEHTFADRHAPMELHLVHRNRSGGLAVVGVMLGEGGQNPLLDRLFSQLPLPEGETFQMEGELLALLPPASSRAVYAYLGSLTTPPASEGVLWFLMKAPVEISAGSIANFTSLYAGTARPVQPLNDRFFFR